MRYLNLLTLVAVAAVTAAVGWSIAHVAGGRESMLVLGWASIAAEVAAGIVVVYLGLRLRAYRNPDAGRAARKDPARRKPYDPVWAVGTAAAAQAIAYYGALCAGWHTGVGVDQLGLLSLRTTQQPLWQCVAQVLAGTALVVTGWIVERSCRLPPDDPDAEEQGRYGGRRDPCPTGEGGYARDH